MSDQHQATLATPLAHIALLYKKVGVASPMKSQKTKAGSSWSTTWNAIASPPSVVVCDQTYFVFVFFCCSDMCQVGQRHA